MSQESDRINNKHAQLIEARKAPEKILNEMTAELRSKLESAQLLVNVLRAECPNTGKDYRLFDEALGSLGDVMIKLGFR